LVRHMRSVVVTIRVVNLVVIVNSKVSLSVVYMVVTIQ
jgi:hypothetical protein